MKFYYEYLAELVVVGKLKGLLGCLTTGDV